MKFLLFAFSLFVSINVTSQEREIVTLKANQSMGIAGQNPGQNAAINPFANQDSIVIIENIGTNPFSIRVKDKEGKTTENQIDNNIIKKIKLFKGSILYFDSVKDATAAVTFKKL